MVPSSLEASASLGSVGGIGGGGRRPTMQLLDYTSDYLVHLETSTALPKGGEGGRGGGGGFRMECRSKVLLSCARTGENIAELEYEAHTDRFLKVYCLLYSLSFYY